MACIGWPVGSLFEKGPQKALRSLDAGAYYDMAIVALTVKGFPVDVFEVIAGLHRLDKTLPVIIRTASPEVFLTHRHRIAVSPFGVLVKLRDAPEQVRDLVLKADTASAPRRAAHAQQPS